MVAARRAVRPPPCPGPVGVVAPGGLVIDAATLDRFTSVTIEVDEELERTIVESIVGVDLAVDILFAVRTMRRNRDAHGLRCVISPRGSMGVARLVKAGFPLRRAIEMRILKAADEATTRKLTETLIEWSER